MAIASTRSTTQERSTLSRLATLSTSSLRVVAAVGSVLVAAVGLVVT
jgi:hypothetical protein